MFNDRLANKRIDRPKYVNKPVLRPYAPKNPLSQGLLLKNIEIVRVEMKAASITEINFSERNNDEIFGSKIPMHAPENAITIVSPRPRTKNPWIAPDLKMINTLSGICRM